ncbi:UBX domain-containing protein 6 [Lutzomyia longipalpis]|uniref:Putative ubiquitin regulatory protein n=1 Tax=Lutzomyia longipalpis TaxID=7200 RepID=A0A7G3B0L4_LUTLO|nr:UBX domain-containing protein 6 [Lutzomyia longipalpis]
MPKKLAQFFAKKKEEAKFKLAGPGRKLNAESQPTTSQKKSKDAYVKPVRKEAGQEARNAAAAAMARCTQKDTKEFNTSLAAIQAQVRRELEAERRAKEETAKVPQPEVQDDRRNLAVQGVYFRCPLVSDEVLSKVEWRSKIKEFLYDQLNQEDGELSACLIIQNCNTKEKADACVETLTKYLENIINHPDEEKYRKIRMSNRIFSEKVRNVEGSMEFLFAAGFEEQIIDGEAFLVYFSKGENFTEQLQVLLDALMCAEKINLEIDRNIQVLLPSQAKKNELPPDFFRMSIEELKREQQLKSEALESSLVLKTKAMREREELRIVNRYRYTLIRVRFPDGVYLQGTFNVYEKFLQVHEFVQSCMKHESVEFHLVGPTGHKFEEEDFEKSLYDLRLVPNILLIFSYDDPDTAPPGNYIKEELLMLIQPL